VGGSGYWRAHAGDEEPGAKPAPQSGDEHDAGPVDADRSAETEASKGWTYKPTGHWLNLDRLSDEALLEAQGYAPTGNEPNSPAQRESGELAYTLEDFDPRLHRSDRLPSESAEAIERFEPRQANLPELTREDAADYIRDNADLRPWLKPAERLPADVQHVIAAVDQGGGHALERHEGYAAGERLERRVGGLEDPAQLDPDLRARGRDARNPDKLHPCKETGTSIDDPAAFAAAFARGVEHPDVRATLGQLREPYENPPPESVEVPIDELLGEAGHQHCAGYRLLPIDGNMRAAELNRREWAKATPEERQHMTRPQTEPIPAEEFQGGTILFGFRKTDDHSHWEIATMFPTPRDRNEQP
jgi:hypothetical protein